MGYSWKIAEREIFNKRFGSMSVAEMRKILFAVYMSNTTSPTRPTDYEIGRNLGLTAIQVKNLRIGANLLLEGDAETEFIARTNLKAAFENQLVEYQQYKKRIAVQVDDPVAFNYLTSKLKNAGIFRDCDYSNGHIAIPVQDFQKLLAIAFEGIDTGAIQAEFEKQYPDFVQDTVNVDGNFFSKLTNLLANSSLEKAVNLVASLSTVISFVLQVSS